MTQCLCDEWHCDIPNNATAQLLKYPQHAFHFLNYAFLEAHQRNKTHLNVHCTLSFIATSRAHENGIFILHFRLCIIYFAEVLLRGGHHGRQAEGEVWSNIWPFLLGGEKKNRK